MASPTESKRTRGVPASPTQPTSQIPTPQSSAQPAGGGIWSEAKFQHRVVQYAEERGYLCYHVPDSRKVVMASPSGAGFPDWVFCRRTGGPTEPVFGFEREVLPPRLLFVELKGSRKGAKPSESQLVWLGSLKAAGAECYLWYPKDWEEVKKVLE